MGRRDNLPVGNTTPNCKNSTIIIARDVSPVKKTGLVCNYCKVSGSQSTRFK